MYCKDCAVGSPENALHCIKCGKPFFDSPKRAPEKVVEFSLAAGPHGGVSAGGLMSRAMVLIMVIGFVVIVASALILRGPGTDARAPVSKPAAGVIAVPDTINGIPNPAALINKADDARVSANVQRIKMAVEQIYAETDAYPESLEAIPADVLGFTPDPAVYTYVLAPDKQSYEVQVKP